MLSEVIVAPRGAERVRGGHLWIYRSDITDARHARRGAVTRVYDKRGRFVAWAWYSDSSEITLRVLTLRDETIDREWWRARIRAALQRRDGLANEADAYRLIYSEGDLLPSFIVDRYADVLVAQTLSQGAATAQQTLVELLIEELQPRAVIERNDVPVRKFEGLPLVNSVLYGDAPDLLEITQHGARFAVTPLGGQKTGAFLDQRENHQAARLHARGKALDCFTCNGGFALSIAPACESVLGLDISEDAIAAAQRNAALNNAENVTFRAVNVFDALREFEGAGERFDTIVLDPPAFAKNRASLAGAVRGYKEINLRALKLLRVGGALITCSCSYHLNETLFLETVATAAADAGRRVQLVEKRMQASDHPVLLGVPETHYLKCLILRVLE